ncbi:unnamed protein product [Effrenium voratum]|uniref:Uncharacterized protein n=1 Tax=Effrenium voratum TaxID=2562239 RepID=A0AA36JAR8_9DINO|nr:unnamed protein product [Effrenium voratum]
MAHAADCAANAHRQRPPPPLPLPPQLTVAQLPQLLRPTGKRFQAAPGPPEAPELQDTQLEGSHDLVAASEPENGPAKPDPESEGRAEHEPDSDSARARTQRAVDIEGSHDLVAASEPENGPAKPDPESEGRAEHEPDSDSARARTQRAVDIEGAHDLVEAPESENGPAKPDPERVVGEEVASEGQGSGLTAPDPESGRTSPVLAVKGDQTDDLHGQPAEVALAIWSEDTSLEEWQAKSFAELAEIVSKILADMATLSSQCDRLFLKSCHSVSGDSYLDVEKLHVLTQLLIDRFGCRSSGTLERIGQVYGAVTAGRDETGLSSLEFQGYTAAVLTQLLQDLESQIASGDLPESRADPQGGLMETLQDWISQLTSALE